MSREERGDLVLPSRSRARQNGSSVCVLRWRLFLLCKNIVGDPKWVGVALLELVLLAPTNDPAQH
jgi:hypothetical protein